jgi:exopolysaccharide biosynthesis polyprenyl glycosylphosphotransferase
MAQDAQPIPKLNIASRVLSPDGRVLAEQSSAQTVTVLPEPRPEADRHDAAAFPLPFSARGVARSGRARLELSLFLLDVVTVSVAWIALGVVLDWSGPTLERFAPGVAGALAMLVAMRGLDLYRSRHCVRKSEELVRVAAASLWGAAAFAVVQTELGQPRPQVLAVAAGAVALAGAGRVAFGRFLRGQRAAGRHLREVLIVGTGDAVARLYTMLRSEPELGYAVAGVVGDATAPSWAPVPSSPSPEDIPRLAAARGATGILVVMSGLPSETVSEAVDAALAANLHVQLWPALPGVASRRLLMVPLSGEPFFYVEPRRIARWQLAVKRVMDVVGALIVLVATAPLLAVLAAIVKLDGGPVFFRGERVGLGGRHFHAYKLRTMTWRGETEPSQLTRLNERTDGPLFKATDDPRVTPIGRFLRATSLDELPQLFNVLAGTMSLVGPRPAIPAEVAQFDAELQRRHTVRPGMTGLWQVEARRNPSFNAYRRLDLRYVDNWSLSQDVAILLATIPAVLSQAVAEWRRRSAR